MDDTIEFLKDLIRRVENKRLKKILKCVASSSPSDDLACGDWNDRQDFMENEYDNIVRDTAVELENIIKG